MRWLSGLWSLIKLIIEWIKSLFKQEEPEPEPEFYTKEQFLSAVSELSRDPVWRAKILKDALDKIKERFQPDLTWCDVEDITQQTLHRAFGCGISFAFGDGVYGMPRQQWEYLIKILQQDAINYVKNFTDCDNFATFFKGFADYICGKPVVIYTTGLVFRVEEVEIAGHHLKQCRCVQETLIGGHGWNRICVTDEPIEVGVTGTYEKKRFDFTVYNYEPQNDVLGDRFMGHDRCYRNGGGLPIIYGYLSDDDN